MFLSGVFMIWCFRWQTQKFSWRLFQLDSGRQSSSCVVGDLRLTGWQRYDQNSVNSTDRKLEATGISQPKCSVFCYAIGVATQSRYPITDYSDAPRARPDALLHERDLQRGLEGGNGIERVIFERCLKVSERVFSRPVRRDVRRPTQRVNRGADGRLGFHESSPNTIRSGAVEAALEALKCFCLISAGYDLFQERPQAWCRQRQAFDLVGQADTESSSAAGCSIAIATKDAMGTDSFLLLLTFNISAHEPMPIERAEPFAKRTRLEFQILEECVAFFLRTTNLRTHR